MSTSWLAFSAASQLDLFIAGTSHGQNGSNSRVLSLDLASQIEFQISLNDRTVPPVKRPSACPLRCGQQIAFLKGVDKSLAFYVTKSPPSPTTLPYYKLMSSYHDQDELNGDVFV